MVPLESWDQAEFLVPTLDQVECEDHLLKEESWDHLLRVEYVDLLCKVECGDQRVMEESWDQIQEQVESLVLS